MDKVILAVIPAVWVVGMAIVSVQNATPVSLKFLAFESVEVPVGVVLSLCAAGGMVLTGVAIAIGQRSNAS